MQNNPKIDDHYARMWPREVFYRLEWKGKKQNLASQKGKRPSVSRLFRNIKLLGQPGVYILYRDDTPYYVGQAEELRTRLWRHACVADARYFNHWNYFSAFVITDPKRRSYVESILIAAMPTANSAKPLKRESFPLEVRKMVREIQLRKANPHLDS